MAKIMDKSFYQLLQMDDGNWSLFQCLKTKFDLVIRKSASSYDQNNYIPWDFPSRKYKISKETASFIIKDNYYFTKKLSVDFDGTLTSFGRFPQPGKPKFIHKVVAFYVRRMRARGYIIILNTMREKGKGLEEALDFMKENNIPFNFVNENTWVDKEKWGDSKKICCTKSIDDTQVGLLGFLLRLSR